MQDIKVLFFDVFGTVVDWRSSLVRELSEFGRSKGVEADWGEFADAWRALYQPSMQEVRSGHRPWVKLDQLHRESLITLLVRFGIQGLTEEEIGLVNTAWHRLDPWPDSVPGMRRLGEKFILSTLSNGNVALLVNMAKRAGLPWDVILGAETAQAYKPLPECYLRNAALLALEPEQCMLVAAHNDDLAAAQELGFHTAFVRRAGEHGPGQTKDMEATGDWDIVAESFLELADDMECPVI